MPTIFPSVTRCDTAFFIWPSRHISATLLLTAEIGKDPQSNGVLAQEKRHLACLTFATLLPNPLTHLPCLYAIYISQCYLIPSSRQVALTRFSKIGSGPRRKTAEGWADKQAPYPAAPLMRGASTGRVCRGGAGKEVRKRGKPEICMSWWVTDSFL